jgi:hypothetical protein
MNRLVVPVSLAAAALGAASVALTSGEVGAASRARTQGTKELVVTLATPTNNQEVLPDLSDPGLNNRITVRFSSHLRAKDVIDNQNVFNRLTPRVEFNDSTFHRLPGTPQVRGNVLTFDPRTPQNDGVLSPGQYTLNVKSSVRNTRGRPLNFGLRDFTTTFSVGTDVYPPVLRISNPIDGQTNIGLNQPIRLTFNEPIDASSVIATIQVQDASTNPPTAIVGAGGGTGITLERNGFDVVFTPDPCFGYPPMTTIQMLVQGQNNLGNVASTVTDVFGNSFRRDLGLQWQFDAATGVYTSPNGDYDDLTGVFRLQFRTRGVTPSPQALPPGSPANLAVVPGNPCTASSYYFAPSCAGTGAMFLYTTGQGLGQIDLRPFIARFNQGVTDYSRITLVQNSPVRTGRPGGLIVDPRYDANAGFHTFIYLVDQRSATVQVIDSRNHKVLSRFGGFAAPRDVAIASDYAKARTTLYVSDFGANQVVGIDLNSFTVNFGGQPGAASPCDEIRDNAQNRQFIPVGRGPTGIAADAFLLNRAIVCNAVDNSASVIDVRRGEVVRTVDVGGNPADVDFTFWLAGAVDIAAIANQGGFQDPDGSISLFLRAPPLQAGFLAAAQHRNGIESVLDDGVKNPVSIAGVSEWAYGQFASPTGWFVANAGGKTIMQLGVNVTGVFGLAITTNVLQTREVGFNPQSAMLDGYYPNQFLFASVTGQGQFAAMDYLRKINPTMINVPGIRRIYTAFSH